MASNSTANYHLPQWEASDPFRMEDFNSAFAAVDTAIKAAANAAGSAGNCCIELGAWTGTGSNSRTVSLPHAPKLMMIFGEYNGTERIGLLTQEKSYIFTSSSMQGMSTYCRLSGNTVSTNSNAYFNEQNKTMRYVSFY